MTLPASEATADAGPSPTEAEQHVFLDHAKNFEFDAVRELIEKDARYVNVQPAGRYSALHQACEKGDEDMVGFLLERGASITAKTSDGETPGEIALRRGHATVAEFVAGLLQEAGQAVPTPAGDAQRDAEAAEAMETPAEAPLEAAPTEVADAPAAASAAAPAAAPAEALATGMDAKDTAVRQRLDRVLAEIRETERAYVVALARLKAFLPLFQQHLADVQLVTSVGGLHGVHQELLGRLERAHELRTQTDPTAHRLPMLFPDAPKPAGSAGVLLADLPPPSADEAAKATAAFERHVSAVAESFVSLTPFLRMYSVYCAGYTPALTRLAELRKASAAAREQFAAVEAANEPLDSLLIKPVQRICKYPLFLRDLLQATPAGAVRDALEAAAAVVHKVNGEVNAKTRESEGSSRLFALHVALGEKLPELLSPTRTFVLELEVKIAAHRATTMATAAARPGGRRLSEASLSVMAAASAASAASALSGRSARRRYKLVLLSDALVLARMRRRARMSGRARPSLVASKAAATSERPPLQLKVVLPLEQLAVTRASAAAVPRRGRRRSSSSSSSSGVAAAATAPAAAAAAASPTMVTASSGGSGVGGGAAAPPGGEGTPSLLLQCRQPAASYSCKCVDVAAAEGVLAAVEEATARLQTSEQHLERRRSLLAMTDVSSDDESESEASDDDSDSSYASDTQLVSGEL